MSSLRKTRRLKLCGNPQTFRRGPVCIRPCPIQNNYDIIISEFTEKERTMPKKALLVVSFGTSYPETRTRTIDRIEEDLKNAFPDREFNRAWTSPKIIAKIRKRDGENIETPDQALDRLAAEGFDDILVQTTHIIAGYEYRITAAQLADRAGQFKRLRFGNPLLADTDDYRGTAGILGELYPAGDVVLMGHGSEHTMNAAYSALSYHLIRGGNSRIRIGCVEGYPEFEHLLPELRETGADRVTLAPLMIVAGDHACRDMTGGPNSWQSRLEADGCEVDAVLRGLGEVPEIRDIFVRHAQNAPDISDIV